MGSKNVFTLTRLLSSIVVHWYCEKLGVGRGNEYMHSLEEALEVRQGSEITL